ncbi:MAG TPA: hypothetical protein DEG06_05070 [Lachnospiraceae bacterium]|nr:hypothetical protein [Lachnospiraceae bacterium]HBY71595.1 hypothetical protein [Lachnospiraceae bacterium]HCA69294.1 hypothetical protein [Lachnospiraceae bacterium]HCM12097.1 hypothetical protein [Lachnospiraceae bacterium]HCR41132.1 hypothetical protein [Lachnospiraceae bacterium]
MNKKIILILSLCIVFLSISISFLLIHKPSSVDISPEQIVKLIDKDEKYLYKTLKISKSDVEEINSEVSMPTKSFHVQDFDCRLQFRVLDEANTLFSFTYIFQNQPLDQIYSWVCDQKDILTSYFRTESTYPKPKFIDRSKPFQNGYYSQYGDGWVIDSEKDARIYLTVEAFESDEGDQVVRVSIFRSLFL